MRLFSRDRRELHRFRGTSFSAPGQSSRCEASASAADSIAASGRAIVRTDAGDVAEPMTSSACLDVVIIKT